MGKRVLHALSAVFVLCFQLAKRRLSALMFCYLAASLCPSKPPCVALWGARLYAVSHGMQNIRANHDAANPSLSVLTC